MKSNSPVENWVKDYEKYEEEGLKRKYLDKGFEGLNKSIGRPPTMSENKKEKIL